MTYRARLVVVGVSVLVGLLVWRGTTGRDGAGGTSAILTGVVSALLTGAAVLVVLRFVARRAPRDSRVWELRLDDVDGDAMVARGRGDLEIDGTTAWWVTLDGPQRLTLDDIPVAVALLPSAGPVPAGPRPVTVLLLPPDVAGAPRVSASDVAARLAATVVAVPGA